MFVYILEVDQSPYSPHQVDDRYFMRLDGQTRPAPHQYIEALFRKITYPNLEGYVRLQKISSKEERHYIINEIEISLFIFNLSEIQNEHDVYLRLETSIGTFQNSLDYIVEDKYAKSVEFKPQSTLYFKSPIRKVRHCISGKIR